MSLVALSGNASGTGTLTIAAPNTNSNFTLTLPTNTGTLISTASTFAGTGPAFFATGAATVCANTVATLVTNGTETFDTNGCYNNTGSTVTLNGISAPAYSFAPNVAGYYQFTAVVFINGSASDRPSIYIYKIGSPIISTYSAGTALSGGQSYQITGLISLNGTSDYVQCYYAQASGSSLTTNSGLTYFCGSLVRGA
jgi:hypothetical protein